MLDGAIANMPDYVNEGQQGDEIAYSPDDPLAKYRPKKKPISPEELMRRFGGESGLLGSEVPVSLH